VFVGRVIAYQTLQKRLLARLNQASISGLEKTTGRMPPTIKKLI
jgi:hypothetical protein